MEDERRCAPPYIHGAVGNVGGAHVDWCIVEISRDKPIRRSLDGYAYIHRTRVIIT